jgi:hypothetical protein
VKNLLSTMNLKAREKEEKKKRRWVGKREEK